MPQLSHRYPIQTVKVILLSSLLLFISGCSLVKNAIMANLMNSLGGIEEIYLTEDDPELVRESMPTNLKLMELMIQQSPDNPELLLSTSQAFTMYGYAFVMRDAELAMSVDVQESMRITKRARKLLRRARRYAFGALEVKYPGFSAEYNTEPEKALLRVGKGDVSLLYWTAAAWGSLISASKDDPAAIIELPNVGYLLERALALDETYDSGALPELMFSYTLSRPGAGSGAEAEALSHYERALELSRGRRASLLVSYAESISVSRQDKEQFFSLLDRALAIDVDEDPSSRLANILAQDRALWLKGRVDELFF